MKENFTKAYFRLINNASGLTLPVIAYYSYLRDKFETFKRLQNADEVFVARSTIKKEIGLSNTCSRKYEEILLNHNLISGKYRTHQGRTHLYFKITEPNRCYIEPNRVDTEPICDMIQTSTKQTTLDRQYEADVLTPEQILIVTGSESFKTAKQHISGLKPQTYLHYKSQVN
jgi:hypothetical protein